MAEEKKEEKKEEPLPFTVCSKADVEGKITFGKGCIVHPNALIYAAADCEIIFGEYNIIEENCRILCKPVKKQDGTAEPKVLKIGNYNWFEAYSDVKANSIGNVNHFQHRTRTNEGVEIKDNCQVMTFSEIPAFSKLESHTIYFGEEKQQECNVDNQEAAIKNIKELADFLATQLPKYNSLKK